MQAPPERVDTYRLYFRSASRAAVWLPQRPPPPKTAWGRSQTSLSHTPTHGGHSHPFLHSDTAVVESHLGAEAAEQRLFGASEAQLAPSLASLRGLRAHGIECERLCQALSRALLALHEPVAVAAIAKTTSQAPTAPPEASFTNEFELVQQYRITYLTLGMLQLEQGAPPVPIDEISPHAARMLLRQLGVPRQSGECGGTQVARCASVLCKLGTDAADAPLESKATSRAALGSAFALCLRASLDCLQPAEQRSEERALGLLTSPPLTDDELHSIFTDLGSSVAGFSSALRAQARAHLASQLEQARAHAPRPALDAQLSPWLGAAALTGGS